MNNYELISEKYIDEIDSNVTIYRHIKSNARICTMKNSDKNKVFSIAFRTPPKDNTGLTHILEHSVLCGSKKYPVKDPFVELMKSSLNTFLNAFTFPDKTMYPVASLNLKDFKNLMSVYMDAVFYPNIYEHKEIFLQEGWHYDLESLDSDIKYNGVVYNEMRGAFSDPESILQRTIMHSLFKDTQYGLESGGDPKYIPDLTYEDFLKFHSEYYSPSNSYIYIYGDLDMEERLEWLDSEYLSKFDKIDFDTTIKKQKPFDKPQYESSYYETDNSLENKTFLSYNIAFPKNLDIKFNIAISILVDVLFNVPGAPLKEKLQSLNLASDISAYLETEIYEPYLSIVASGSNESKEEEFINVINEELNKYIENGLDKEAILSLINHNEFESREKDFSMRMPKGLLLMMEGLSTWLYDDNKPFDAFITIKYYKELKDDLNNNYFESLIKDYFINNNHKSFVKLIPTFDSFKNSDLLIKEKLDKYKKSLTKEELNDLLKMNKELIDYQNEESTLEDINKLPKLSEADLNIDIEKYNLDIINDKLLFSNYNTNGITYLYYRFMFDDMSKEDLSYLSLYLDMFKQISTKNYSYYKINQLITKELGSLECFLVPLRTINNETKILFSFYFSALDSKAKIGNDLLIELLNNQLFNDTNRIYKRLQELKNQLEMSISSKGHSVSAIRSLSFIEKYSYYRDVLGGIYYLDFINDLYNNFEDKKEEIVNHLYNIKNMFSKNNLITTVTSDKNQFNNLLPLIDEFKNNLCDIETYNKEEFIKNPHKEAIIAPYNVNYCAISNIFNTKFDYASRVLENAISKDYLWLNVRVHNGAYGVMLNISDNNSIVLTSYRDPNVDKTIDAYRGIVDYIDSFNPSNDELLKYKIGAIASAQTSDHVRTKGVVASRMYLTGLTYDKLKENIKRSVDATLDDLKNTKEYYESIKESNNICILGNKESIEKSNIKFDVIRNLIK